MDLSVQPNLVERTVFEAARMDAALRPQYERQFADCYDDRPGDRRDRAFAKLHERWFNDLGLREVIAGWVNEFPHLRDRVSRMMVLQAPGPKAQTAELFGAPGRYTVVIAIVPALLLDRPAHEYWVRHELMHLDDMLDPAFGYDPTHRPSGETTAERNLIQDRYAVLWAMSVDARLIRRGQAPLDVRSKREAETIRAFSLKPSDEIDMALRELWAKGGRSGWPHQTLLDWARLGIPGLGDLAGPRATERTARPGAACPLCEFPTFDWLDDAAELAGLEDAIAPDFPGRSPREPICRRCAEVYRNGAPERAVSARQGSNGG